VPSSDEPAVETPAPEAPAPVAAPAPAPVEAPAPKRKAQGRTKAKTFVFKGSVVAVDAAAGTVDVRIAKGNSRGRRFAGEVVTFAVPSADDVVAGDRVAVHARLAQNARPDGTVLSARKLVVLTEREPAPVVEPAPQDPAPEPVVVD
jgi:hypothetical protein